MPNLRRVMRTTTAAILLLGIVGRPASADDMVATAEGHVLVNGEPLAAGKIFFYLDEDQFVGSKIKEGAFRLSRLPMGAWRVVIEGEGVPRTYSSDSKSVLTVNVTQTRNTFDFHLKGR